MTQEVRFNPVILKRDPSMRFRSLFHKPVAAVLAASLTLLTPGLPGHLAFAAPVSKKNEVKSVSVTPLPKAISWPSQIPAYEELSEMGMFSLSEPSPKLNHEFAHHEVSHPKYVFNDIEKGVLDMSVISSLLGHPQGYDLSGSMSNAGEPIRMRR
jgi:hypothetical protein